MPDSRYKYVANKTPGDGTTSIKVGGKVLQLNGESVALTDAEAARAERRYVLEAEQASRVTSPATTTTKNDNQGPGSRAGSVSDITRR